MFYCRFAVWLVPLSTPCCVSGTMPLAAITLYWDNAPRRHGPLVDFLPLELIWPGPTQ